MAGGRWKSHVKHTGVSVLLPSFFFLFKGILLPTSNRACVGWWWEREPGERNESLKFRAEQAEAVEMLGSMPHIYRTLFKHLGAVSHHCLHNSGLWNASPIVFDKKMWRVHGLTLPRPHCETEVGLGEEAGRRHRTPMTFEWRLACLTSGPAS